MGQEKVLSAMYNSAVFYSPADNQPYVETYLLFDGGSLNYVMVSDGKYRANGQERGLDCFCEEV